MKQIDNVKCTICQCFLTMYHRDGNWITMYIFSFFTRTDTANIHLTLREISKWTYMFSCVFLFWMLCVIFSCAPCGPSAASPSVVRGHSKKTRKSTALSTDMRNCPQRPKCHTSQAADSGEKRFSDRGGHAWLRHGGARPATLLARHFCGSPHCQDVPNGPACG